MGRRMFTAEQIVGKLREAEVLLSQGGERDGGRWRSDSRDDKKQNKRNESRVTTPELFQALCLAGGSYVQ